jgi:hypothetical protein
LNRECCQFAKLYQVRIISDRKQKNGEELNFFDPTPYCPLPISSQCIFSSAGYHIRLIFDLFRNGGDYTVETLPEAPAVQAYGGKISLIQIEIPTSTTEIVNRILQKNNGELSLS